MRRAALVLCAALAGGPVAAQWTTASVASSDLSRATASVSNEDGAVLRIWLEEGESLHAAFRLPRGLVTLDPDACPTFQVDERPIENLSAPEHGCSSSADEATLTLTRVRDGRVDSTTLLELMNGRRLTVRYRLSHAGYGATVFTLRKSKQAIIDILGEELAVAGD